MQDGTLAANGYGQRISGATGRDSEHKSRGGGYKTRERKKGMTIPNNPECLYRPLGAERGNTAKWKSGRNTTTTITCQRGRRGTMKAYVWMGRKSYLMTSGTMEKVRNIVVLPGSMQKTALNQAILALARSKAKAAIKLRSQPHRPILST